MGALQHGRPQRNNCCREKAFHGVYPMKIAQVSPLMESVPPRLYGTERIVSYLTEELVELGHDVTLFASADSITAANLVGCAPVALRLEPRVRDPIPYYLLMLNRVREQADRFDIIHFHIDQFHFPIFYPIAGRTITTLHGRQDLPDLTPLYIGFNDMPQKSRTKCTATSEAGRKAVREAKVERSRVGNRLLRSVCRKPARKEKKCRKRN